MAGDWIKMTHSLLTAPEVVRISSALKADKLRTIGGLYVLWCVGDLHADDSGMLPGYAPEDLDDVLNWPGFSRAVMDQGWLEQKDEGMQFPNFERHNGKSAKRRALDASRKGAVRKMSASDADKTRNRGEERRVSEKKETPSPTPPPSSASDADKMRTGKRQGRGFKPTTEAVRKWRRENGYES